MKKIFEASEIEIILMDDADIISTSPQGAFKDDPILDDEGWI